MLLEEHEARELLKKSALHEESGEKQKAHVQLWIATAVCALIFTAAYAFIAYNTYDFGGVRKSLAQASEEIKNVGTKAAPDIDKAWNMWGEFKAGQAKEAQAKAETNLAEEMKKNLETKKSE
ncbi:MAG: hypothetical protein WCJ29_06130 [bacterium]